MPDPAKMTPAARIERNSLTYDASRVPIALARARDHEIAARFGSVLDATHDLSEVRVGDVVDDYAHDRDLAT